MVNAAWKMFKSTNFYQSMKYLWKTGTSTARGVLRSEIRAAGYLGGAALRTGGRATASGEVGVFRRSFTEAQRSGRSRMAATLREGRKLGLGPGAKKRLAGVAAAQRASVGPMAKQYFWPGAYNLGWADSGLTRNINVPTEQLGLRRLKRVGGVAASAWIGTNLMRRGNQIGPF